MGHTLHSNFSTQERYHANQNACHVCHVITIIQSERARHFCHMAAISQSNRAPFLSRDKSGPISADVAVACWNSRCNFSVCSIRYRLQLRNLSVLYIHRTPLSSCYTCRILLLTTFESLNLIPWLNWWFGPPYLLWPCPPSGFVADLSRNLNQSSFIRWGSYSYWYFEMGPSLLLKLLLLNDFMKKACKDYSLSASNIKFIMS